MTKKGVQTYIRAIQKYPKTYAFLEKRNIQGIKKLTSRWRQQNLLLKIKCQDMTYIFKDIADEGKALEIPRIKALKQEYPTLLPEVFVSEGNSFLMEFIDGPTFFELDTKQKVDAMRKAELS